MGRTPGPPHQTPNAISPDDDLTTPGPPSDKAIVHLAAGNRRNNPPLGAVLSGLAPPRFTTMATSRMSEPITILAVLLRLAALQLLCGTAQSVGHRPRDASYPAAEIQLWIRRKYSFRISERMPSWRRSSLRAMLPDR